MNISVSRGFLGQFLAALALTIVATSSAFGHSAPNGKEGEQFYHIGLGLYSHPSEDDHPESTELVIHASGPGDGCQSVLNVMEDYYPDPWLDQAYAIATNDDQTEWEVLCSVHFIDAIGVENDVYWRGDLFCIAEGENAGELNWVQGVCPPPTGSCEAGTDYPITISSGRKIKAHLDWASALDPRFQVSRDYSSSVAWSDPTVGGLGIGWTSSYFSRIERRETFGSSSRWWVFLGDFRERQFNRARSGFNPFHYVADSGDHGYAFQPRSGTTGDGVTTYNAVVRNGSTGQEYRFADVPGSLDQVLVELAWPDGYAMWFEHDVDYRVVAMTDNRGQRAEFSWLSALGDTPPLTTEFFGWPMTTEYANQISVTEPVISDIDVDTDYDGVNFAPDIAIDYEYGPQRYYIPTDGGVTVRSGVTATRALVTSVSDGAVLSDRQYEYDSNNPQLLTAVLDGRLDASGQLFAYEQFSYALDDRDPSGVAKNRAISSTHFNGADLAQVSLPVYGTPAVAGEVPPYDVTVTNSLGKETIYSFERHEGSDRLVGVEGVSTVNCLPSDTTATYDDNGRITERVGRNGTKTTIARDSVGRVLTRTEDADGASPRTINYTWTSFYYSQPAWGLRKPLTRTTSELSETFTYDDDGLQTSYTQTDVLAGSPYINQTRTWTYTYTTLASGLKVLTALDGPGLVADGIIDVTTYTYNDRGQLLTTTDPNGLTQEVLAYGLTGQPTLIRDHQGFEWALEYDLEGQLTQSTFEPNGANDVTTYTYDIIGQMISSTDALNRTWGYTYDEAKRLVEITAPSGETISFEHDAMGNVTQTEYSDASAIRTYLEQTQYDELGRVLQAIGSNGQSTQFSHDVEDNLSTVSDADNLTTTLSYDALNRMSDIVDRANFTTSMEHDTDNQMTSYTDPRGIETAFVYNGFGDLISEVSADRGTLSYSYNNRGLPTSMTDGRGVVTNYSYDNGGRLTSKTYPSDATLDQTFSYHSSGNIPTYETLLSPVSARTSSTYPGYGGAPELVFDGIVGGENYIHTYNGVQEFAEVDLGSEQTLTKTVVTNRASQGARLNGAMVVAYDSARTEVYRSVPIAGASNGMVFSFELGGMVNAQYVAVEHSNQWLHISELEVFGLVPTVPTDPNAPPTEPHNTGMLASVTDQSGRTDYSNDPTRGAFHEDLRQMDGVQYSTTYSSDATGQTTQMDYPSGSELTFSYDADGDISGLQWRSYDPTTNSYATPINVVSNMTYLPMGPLTGMTYGDGGSFSAGYDSSYRLTSLSDTRAGTALRTMTYSWSNRDNLETVTNTLDPTQNETYDYTAREFLSAADGAWGELDWLYDSVGNRTQQMSFADGATTTDVYSYPTDSNRLEDIAFSAGGLRELTYDDAGNVTFDNRNGPGYGYNYDAAGRMSSFAINGVIQAEYAYNHLGQQVIRRLPQSGEVIHAVHDALGNRIAEYDYDETTGTSTLIREYIWASDLIVAVVEDGNLYSVRTDHIGRPVFATDSTGVKVWEASYLPFGGVQTSSGPNSELRFPGQWFQSETGLHQNWMRDYDPTLGRYLQADPLGLVDGASVYGYALQNPGRYVDPRGEQTLTIDPGMSGGDLIPGTGGQSTGGISIPGTIVRGLGLTISLMVTPGGNAGDGSMPMPCGPVDQCHEKYLECRLTKLDDLDGRVHGNGRCQQCLDACHANGGVWPLNLLEVGGPRKSCRYWLPSYN